MKPPRRLVTEHDVIRLMGRFPDRIVTSAESIFNKGVWECTECGWLKPKTGPCECGSISWIKRREAKE